MKRPFISTYFLLSVTIGILGSGCISQSQSTDLNSTAIAIALNDSRMKTHIAHDGSYEIVAVGPTTFETDHTSMKVIGVDIDTQYDLYHVYVDVGNRRVVSIWSQPKRSPIPSQ